ncbi:MAG: site-2 protease family protein [Nibricoccus sp.]
MLNGSIRLFRVAGIQLSVHNTFFLLLAYYAWDGWQDAGGHGSAGAISALVSASLVLFLFIFVVLHEFGHAFAARHYGIAVPRILLLPIGGMAQMSAIPRNPWQEFVITIAGPAVNFAIVGFMMIFAPFHTEQILAHVRQFLGLKVTPGTDMELAWPQFIMLMNLLMGCFNLIPVFPMDGGRMLRATLASRLPYVKATWIAATIAKVLAVAGVLLALFWFDPARIQLALLFGFIFFAGHSEYKMVQRREAEDAQWRQMLAELHARSLHVAPSPVAPPEKHS